MAKKKPKAPSNTIAQNKKARFDYFIEKEYEAGIALEGWEVKSLRDGKAQLKESYVLVSKGEIFLQGAHFTPLKSASTHVKADPVRVRKLLLNRHEISQLIGSVERDGYTIAPLALYWKGPHVKIKIGLAKGKQQHDKRQTIKERDWKREQHRVLKRG